MLKNNLRAARKRKGLSQANLTQQTGIAPSIISSIENGKLYAYPAWRKKFAKALGVNEQDLFPGPEVEKCATSSE